MSTFRRGERPQVRGGAWAWAILAAICVGLTLGVAPPALQTMATDDIEPGMRGYGLTVLRGTEPERFDVEVIDVLHNFRPDQDLILVRTPHPILEKAGAVAGMSGSPVFIDGKLVGAYAYGWTFGKEPIAGVTPIANMLAELRRPLEAFPVAGPLPRTPRARRPRRAYLGQRPRGALYALEHLRRAPPTSHHAQLAPLATPLLLSGMSPEVAHLLEEQLAPLGFAVLEAGGAASKGAQAQGPDSFVNGGSIAVSLLSGDIQATGVGTVTYVDGERLVAFGHPMLDAGEVRMPTATSRVLHVLASARSSFKIAETLRPLGTLVHDRQSAIVVDQALTAPTLPLHISVSGLPAGLREEWNVQVVKNRMLTGPLLLSAIASALGATWNDQRHAYVRATTRVRIDRHGTRTYLDEAESRLGASRSNLLGMLRVFDVIEAAYANPFEEADIVGIDIHLELAFERRETELLGARLVSEELDPGEPARLVIDLLPYGAAPTQRVIEVPLPEAYAGEKLEIELNPGNETQADLPLPRSFDDVLDAIDARRQRTALVVTVTRERDGLALPGHVAEALPRSMIDTLMTAQSTPRALRHPTSRDTIVPMDAALSGSARLRVSVREEKR